MLVEVILELLVGIVDTELLKTVPLEVFKPKDVEDSDRQALERWREWLLLVSTPLAATCLMLRVLEPVIFFVQTLKFVFCIGVQPVNNAVIVSSEQRRDSASHTPVSFSPQPPPVQAGT